MMKRFACLSLAAAACLLPGLALAEYDNERLEDEILALGIAHNAAFAPSFSPDPVIGLNAGNITYSTNLGLKYVPPVLRAPDTVGYAPTAVDGCSYTFTIGGAARKTRQDYLGLLIDYEDDFVWADVLGSPDVFHANTDVAVSVFRGDEMLDGTVTLPVGTHTLRWRGETLIVPLLDYPPWHLLLAEVVEAASRKAVIGLKTPAARRETMQAIIELGIELGIEGATFGVDWFLVDGVPTPTTGEGIFHERTQTFRVFDTTVPVFEPRQSEFTVEATQVGGEYLRDHISELRDGFDVTDTCDRRPIVNYSGPGFMPVGEITEITWTARDNGPVDIDGGFNQAEFVQRVRVQDTLPPIVLPPPGRVVESESATALDIGWPAVFDLADVRPGIESDAPGTFRPDTRTLVTWRATDASGNSTTENQWITLKAPGTNTAPTADSRTVAARTFEPVEIELTAADGDLISGRYDQLAFRITEPPANGFFVAPLFPYFIEDHRVENAFGLTKQELDAFLDAECAADPNNYVPPVDFVTDPMYMTVDDDGIAYVSDQYLTCSRSGGKIERKNRIARFIKDENGELAFDTQIDTSSVRPDSLSVGRNGSIYYRGVPVDSGTETVRGCDPDLTDCAVYRIDVDTSLANPDRLFPTKRLTSMVADENDVLYVTDGRNSLAAYDLRDVRANSVVGVLGSIAGVGDLQSSGLARKDLAIDSEGNLYVSDFDNHRVYKFSASTVVRNDDGSVDFTPGEFIGWMGRCDSNETAERACDEIAKRSYGYSCSTERCGVVEATGSAPGQFDSPRGIAIDANDVLYVTDYNNLRVQRFTPDGFFAGEAESECDGSCFVLGDFGNPEDVSANLQFFYVLDRERDLLHVFETTPVTDFDDDTLQPTQTARVTYQSDEGFKGTDSFRFAVSDGLAVSNDATVTVDVTRNFRPPVATEGQAFETAEDTALEFRLAAFDPDADDQPNLQFSIEKQPENGTITAAGADNGPDFVYTPATDFFGTEVFEFSVSDGGMSSATLAGTIEVTPVNDPPVVEFAGLNSRYGAGFEIKLEARISDVDLTDRHVYGIDWGPGEPFTSGRALPPGEVAPEGEPTFVQSADGSAVLVDEATYFSTGTKTVTVCASDVPGVTALASCADPNVSALATRTLTIEPMVSKAIVITDNAPTEAGELGTEVVAPVMDGEAFAVLFAVHNLEPNDVGTVLEATDVAFTAKLGPGLEVSPFGIVGIAGDATGVDCSAAGTQVDCTIASIPVGGQARIGVEVVGDGTIAADSTIAVMAMATSAEDDHNGMIGNTKTYKLTPDPDGDADGDGVINSADVFPGDPSEQSDFDGDGIGDNADSDDDNDRISDTWERRYGLDERNAADAAADDDGDGLTNAEEFEKGTRPDTDDTDLDTRADAVDNCPLTVNVNQYDQDTDGAGDACDVDALAGAVALGDADGGGGSDYALLRTHAGRYGVFLKDGASDESIAADRLDLGAVADRRLAALTAVDGDPAVLFGDGAAAARLSRIDAGDGTTRFDVEVAPEGWAPFALLAAGAELWSLFEHADGRLLLARSRAADGATLGTVELGDGLEPLATVSSGVGELALLGFDRTSGDVLLRWHGTADGALRDARSVGAGDTVAALLAALPDGLAVALQSQDGQITVSTWAADGSPTASFAAFAGDSTLLGMHAVPGTGALALAALSGSGTIRVQITDPADGSVTATRDYATPSGSYRGSLAATGGGGAEVGILLADAANEVSLELQAAAGAAAARVLTAESVAPPPPPPPPGDGDDDGDGGDSGASGSGGGGGVFDAFFGLLVAGLVLMRRLRPTCPSARTAAARWRGSRWP